MMTVITLNLNYLPKECNRLDYLAALKNRFYAKLVLLDVSLILNNTTLLLCYTLVQS